MVRGPEWTYVEELKHGRTTLHVRCRSCGHTFHGSATRIKEHLLSIGVNVEGCPTPPSDINIKLNKYISKLKKKGDAQPQKRVALASEDTRSMFVGDTEQPSQHNVSFVDQSLQGQCSRAPSTGVGGQSIFDTDPATYVKGTKEQISINAAFEKQSMLELHLKWTQAFMACGIAFNVIRNPVFQDALMSTAKRGFVLPDYNKMRTEYVDKIKSSTEAILKRTVLDFVPAFGCTIALDGWTSCQKKPLINIMCICPRGSVFLDAIDTSLKEKTIPYLTKIYERAIAKVGGPKNVTAIVTDNASNYKGAGHAIQEKFPEITWVACAAHTINLLLKDIGKMSFVQQTLLDANHVVKFIREHQFTYALFRTKSPTKTLTIFCATHFATAYYVLKGLCDVCAALNETVSDRRWDAWVAKNTAHVILANKCVQLVRSQTFWQNVEKIVGLATPFVDLLRLVDTEKFIIGKVYWHMSEAICHVKDYNHFTTREKAQITTVANARWVQMHTPLHGAAFALEPSYQVYSQSSNNEVRNNFKHVCQQMLPREEAQEAYNQQILFANREGAFGDPWHLDAIKRVSSPIWWKEYGGDTVELQHVATRVLSVAASSGSCERNWSAFNFVHTKRRNRLNPSRANDLVYVFCNMKLIHCPRNIATRAVLSSNMFQTHSTVAEERASDSEMEWEIGSENSDMDEVDDMVPVLVTSN